MTSEEREVLTTVVAALIEAEAHLEYCGYGDRFERECATEEQLPEQIQAALKIGIKAIAK